MSVLPGLEEFCYAKMREHVDGTPGADSDEFFTPRWLLAWLGRIALDPCYCALSHVIADLMFDIRRGEDGLLLPWRTSGPGIVFVNFPYNDAATWTARCRQQSLEHNVVVVALMPAYPGESYWHKQIWKAMPTSVGFINGRIAFDKMTEAGVVKKEGGGRFGSALVIWGDHDDSVRKAIARRARGHAQAPFWVGPVVDEDEAVEEAA